MRTAEGRRRYRERFGQLYTNVFKLDQVLGRIDEIEAAIVPAVAKVDRQEARTQEQQAAWFKAQITRRHDALSQQLGAPVEPLKFGSDGVLQLTAWRQAPGRNGGANLSEVKDEKEPVLVVSASGNGSNNGFWRKRVVLAPHVSVHRPGPRGRCHCPAGRSTGRRRSAHFSRTDARPPDRHYRLDRSRL